MKIEKMSYSRLTTFLQCEYQYFNQYVIKQESEDNIYSAAGSTVHNIIEEMQEEKLEKDEALTRFKEEMELHKILGFTFTSEKTEHNFIQSIEHYIEHFKPINKKVEIEKYFEADFNGYKVVGFIDLLVHNEDGSVSIIDLKTSSKYSKKAIEEHCNQLLIYAIAMQQEGYDVRDIAWDMMKYVNIPTKRGKKMILRSELTNEEFENAYVYYPLTDENKKQCKEWVVDTIKKIESKDELFDEWKANCDESFFCTRLCSYCGKCKKGIELRERYFKGR